MAEPGDPKTPPEAAPDARPASDDALAATLAHDHAHAHDDLIGFTSPSSLSGRLREPEPQSESELAAEGVTVDDDLFASSPQTTLDAADEVAPEAALESPAEILGAPDSLPLSAPEEPIFAVAPAPISARPEPDAGSDASQTVVPDRRPETILVPPAMAAVPAWAVETPQPPVADRPAFGRADSSATPPEGAMGLYTIYALILFAVPTLGVAALIALVAVIGRPAPQQALALSHHLYQKRTLWIAAIAAALGVVLIAVNLGVFVLFILAVWVVIRGATGILRLSAGRAIAQPNGWLF